MEKESNVSIESESSNSEPSFFKELVLLVSYLQKLYLKRGCYSFINDDETACVAPIGEKRVICHYAGEKARNKACRKLLLRKVIYTGLNANAMKLVDHENIGNKKAVSIIQPCRKQ
ncbi:MAG: hypothetical protein U5L10_02890 [Candidatus Moranbacteria bacterium]|nr:hypothetical protein [Candidatus Moranbacteria bacterium]